MKKQITALSCGIFKREIEALVKSGKLDLSIRFLDSMLHMAPARLETLMEKNIDKLKGEPTIMIYGDCHPTMYQMDEKSNVSKVAGMNCCEIILGKKKYQALRAQGAFFLLPEWTQRWESVFKKHLGFNQESAKTFMAEMHSTLIYLDTGVWPVPQKKLEAVSQFCGLPIEIMPVDLDHLLSAILDATRTVNHGA
jgi:hypothetical protein